MEQTGVQLDRETFCCVICLDLLHEPVTILCGHSYCLTCIETHWNQEDHNQIYSCPQCRKSFTPRPILLQNTMLAALVEQLKRAGVKDAPAHYRYSGSEDVSCDVCIERKLKALKTCLTCLASYCEEHLRDHILPGFDRHKLLDASKELQENIRSRQDDMMKVIYCTHEQRAFEVAKQNVRQRIRDREKDVKVLQEELGSINSSANQAVEDNEQILTRLITFMEKKRSDLKRQVRFQQITEVCRVKELQEKLEWEVTELKKISQADDKDQDQLLRDLESEASAITKRPLRYFDDMKLVVSEVRGKLQEVLREKWTNISQTPVDVLLTPPEPKTRAEFLKHSCDLTMDPNTAYPQLLVAEGDRKATFLSKPQTIPRHPEKFTAYSQVLCRESLTGRCYWEVEYRGGVFVAVAYKSIQRNGYSDECRFGKNVKSWALDCHKHAATFLHNHVKTPVPAPQSSRIGVYLDHYAGVLCFYSVFRETMTLIHRVQTIFTEPLHAGLCLYNSSCCGSAEFCQLTKDI